MKKAKVKATQVHEKEATAVIDAPLQQKPKTGTLLTVPRAKVRPDPNQPRKVFNEESLKELAESIRLQGIIQPLVVRLMPAKLKIEEPNLMHDDWQVVDDKGAVVFSGNEGPVKMFAGPDAEEFYQIVFGERRWRASELAGLTEIPVIVRELTDRDTFIQQFIENNGRENLSALEEAKAFQERIAKEKEADPSFNADKLAEILGIARATVYNRLTLTRLTEPVLEALKAGKIQTTVAGLIAMIPDPKQQEKLLKKLTNEEDWQFPFSFRDVEEIIEEEYCKQLKDAPFDQADPELMHEMGTGAGVVLYGGPCKTCVARSGNMKGEFPHIKNLNVCTKPECFAKKCQAHFAAEAAEAEKKGQKVFTQKDFKKVRSQYVRADDYDREFDTYSYWGELMGKKAPKPALVITEDGLQHVYPKEEAVEAAKRNGKKLRKPQTAEEKLEEAAKRQENEKTFKRRSELVESLLPKLSKSLAGMKDALAWKLAAEMGVSANWPRADMKKVLVDNVKSEKAVVLGVCFASSDFYPVSSGDGSWKKDIVEYWQRAGIDLLQEEKAQAPSDALPLAKSESKQKELLTVKKNKKKS